jgi:diguanylate cyclase (GGDEF)-like protein
MDCPGWSGDPDVIDGKVVRPLEMRASDMDFGKVLLIGNMAGALLDPESLRELPCEVYPDISEALDAAAHDSFAAVSIVISGLSCELPPALRTLRQVTHDARIILLAQMLEEPLAMQLVDSAPEGPNLADDYLICPVSTARLFESLIPATAQRPAEPLRPRIDGAVERKIEQLQKLATEDDLTGLKNRRYMWEFARQIIEHAGGRGGRVTLLLFDVDNLKSYTDAYGHLAGDEILKEAAVLMRRSCRQHDVVGRLGGDEFAVIFWDGPSAGSLATENERRSTSAEHPTEAISIAKRFQSELKKAKLPLLGPGGKGVLTISGGLASFPRDGATIDELFRKADRALLEAKRGGKNKIYLVGRPESDIADIQ